MDLVLNLPNDGIRLVFDPVSQRLKVRFCFIRDSILIKELMAGCWTTNLAFNIINLFCANCSISVYFNDERRGGLMVSAVDFGSSGPGSGPGRGHCVVFLGKTLYSHGASLHPGV